MPRGGQGGIVLRELSLCLRELHLKGTSVNLREQVPLVNHLAFGERDVDELSIDAAADGDGIERRHGPEARQIDVEVALARGRRYDGNGALRRLGGRRGASEERHAKPLDE